MDNISDEFDSTNIHRTVKLMEEVDKLKQLIRSSAPKKRKDDDTTKTYW
jgi:hypothetical protein